MAGHDVESFVACTASGCEEHLDLSGGQGFGLFAVAAATGPLADCYVAGDQVVPDSLRERLLEGDVDVVTGASRERLVLLGA